MLIFNQYQHCCQYYWSMDRYSLDLNKLYRGAGDHSEWSCSYNGSGQITVINFHNTWKAITVWKMYFFLLPLIIVSWMLSACCSDEFTANMKQRSSSSVVPLMEYSLRTANATRRSLTDTWNEVPKTSYHFLTMKSYNFSHCSPIPVLYFGLGDSVHNFNI